MSGKLIPEEILDSLYIYYPQMNIVLTLGEKGSLYYEQRRQKTAYKAFPVEVVDTTAAGDAFTGYFLSEILRYGKRKKLYL